MDCDYFVSFMFVKEVVFMSCHITAALTSLRDSFHLVGKNHECGKTETENGFSLLSGFLGKICDVLAVKRL